LEVAEADMVNLRWRDLAGAVLPETEIETSMAIPTGSRPKTHEAAALKLASEPFPLSLRPIPQAERRRSAAPLRIAVPFGENLRGKGLGLFDHVACDLFAPAIDRHESVTFSRISASDAAFARARRAPS
jgi:hypothetical protein